MATTADTMVEAVAVGLSAKAAPFVYTRLASGCGSVKGRTTTTATWPRMAARVRAYFTSVASQILAVTVAVALAVASSAAASATVLAAGAMDAAVAWCTATRRANLSSNGGISPAGWYVRGKERRRQRQPKKAPSEAGSPLSAHRCPQTRPSLLPLALG